MFQIVVVSALRTKDLGFGGRISLRFRLIGWKKAVSIPQFLLYDKNPAEAVSFSVESSKSLKRCGSRFSLATTREHRASLSLSYQQIRVDDTLSLTGQKTANRGPLHSSQTDAALSGDISCMRGPLQNTFKVFKVAFCPRVLVFVAELSGTTR